MPVMPVDSDTEDAPVEPADEGVMLSVLTAVSAPVSLQELSPMQSVVIRIKDMYPLRFMLCLTVYLYMKFNRLSVP